MQTRQARCLRPSFLLTIAAYTFLALNLLYTAPLSEPLRLVDLGSLLASGRAAAEGENPYGVGPLVFHAKFGDVEGPAINLNPPLSVLFFQLAAPLDPRTVFRVWYGVSLGLYALIVALVVRAYREYLTPLRRLWLVSLAGLWSTLELGQIYMPLVLAAVAAWLCLRRGRYLYAGLLIGFLVALKPNFAVWPVLLLLSGYRRAAVSAFVSFGVLSALPALVYSPTVYVQWLEIAGQRGWSGWPNNVSLLGMADRVGVPSLGIFLSGMLLLAAAGWAWRFRPPVLTASIVGLAAALLASPVAWTGYTLCLVPYLLGRQWPIGVPLLRVAAVLLTVPTTITWSLSTLSPVHLAVFGSLHGVAVLLVFAHAAREALIQARGARVAELHERSPNALQAPVHDLSPLAVARLPDKRSQAFG